MVYNLMMHRCQVRCCLNPVHLKTFLTVRKHRNYTRAASELFISQPAVSRRIRELERELGVRLFEQLGRALHLTGAGEALAAEAEGLLGSMERAAEAVRSHALEGKGRLRVGASVTPGCCLLPKVVGEFHRQHPESDLTYTVANSRAIERGIVANELDLGLIGKAPKNAALAARPVVMDEIICVAAPSHSLAGRKRVAPAALANEICVVREQGSATRGLAETWFAGAGCKFRRFIELSSSEAIKALVASGVGLSLISVHAVEREIENGGLCRIPVSALNLKRPIYLVQHLDKHLSPAIRSFVSLLDSAFQG